MSEIVRCRKTIAQNGVSASANLDASDRYCLDGQQLRLTSGVYGESGSQYRTEIERFSRVTANGAAGTGPASFLVEQKDGLRATYGGTASGLIESQGSSSARAWLVTQVADRTGNSINIEYYEDTPDVWNTTGGAYRPHRITWSHGNGNGGPYKLEFFYESRPDVVTRYVAGGVVREPNRVDRIDLTYNGTLVRRYDLTYATGPASSRSRIASIQECAGITGGDCLPSSAVSYQNGATGWTAAQVWPGLNLAGADFRYPVVADFNGDGIKDVLYAVVSTGATVYALGTTSGTYVGPYAAGIPYDTLARAIDWNSDGRTDVLGYTGIFQFVTPGAPFSLAVPNVGAGFAPADLDGDGRVDLVRIAGGQNTISWSRNTGSGFAAEQVFYTAPNGQFFGFWDGWQTWFDPQLVDFNGDGRTDILVQVQNGTAAGVGWAALAATGNSFAQIGFIPAPATFTPHYVKTTDNNGDGCTDILQLRSSNANGSVPAVLWHSTCGRSGTTN